MTKPKTSPQSLQRPPPHGETLREQLFRTVGERLLASETVREVVKKEVIRSVSQVTKQVAGQVAGQVVGQAVASQSGGRTNIGSKAAQDKAAQSKFAQGKSANVVSQLSEVWQHPAVQGAVKSAVKGGVQVASSQARQWQERARDKAAERVDEQRLRRQQRGAYLSPAEAVELAQRQAERDKRRRQQATQARYRQAAQTEVQRQVLEQVFLHTPWLGGQLAPLRYTQMLDTLAPNAEPRREMSLHRALWSLAEVRLLSVSPHGEITLSPLPDKDNTARVDQRDAGVMGGAE